MSAFRFWCRLLSLHSDDVGLGKAQAGCNHLSFDDHLPPLLPGVGLVAVIGRLSDDDDLQSLPECLGGVFGDGTEGDDAVEDGREVLVLVGFPVEALAVDGEIKVDDSPAVAGLPKYGVCRHVADDGEFVHEVAPGWIEHGSGGTACCRTPASCSAVGLAVCLVVGVDDVLFDTTALAHVHALRLCPGADLWDVIPCASATPAPVASPWRWCSLTLNAPTFLNVGAKHIIEPLGIFFREVDLVVLAVHGISDGFRAFGLIQVVDQYESLCHGFLPRYPAR